MPHFKSVSYEEKNKWKRWIKNDQRTYLNSTSHLNDQVVWARIFVWPQQKKERCGTGQDELSNGCKCFQQLLLQWVEHIQSIPKQIKSSGQPEWEKLQRTGWQSHTQMNSPHSSPSMKIISKYTKKYSLYHLIEMSDSQGWWHVKIYCKNF